MGASGGEVGPEPFAGAESPAAHAAATLLGALVRHGVADLVLSPGSRSQALALAAVHLERRGILRLHVRIDERVAAFTALGMGRESEMPAAVVCTSGTAVANLLPAVLEAHHAGVPLLLLTADRPPEVRGVGANQTTRQPGIFAGFVRWAADLPVPERCDDAGTDAATAVLRRVAADAVRAAVGGPGRAAGPVHLNLPYREPLSGRMPAWFEADPPPAADPGAADVAAGAGEAGALYQGGGGVGDIDGIADLRVRVLEPGPRTVVVAGADAGPDAEAAAHAGGWPLVAEIVSGARFGRNVVPAYRAVLRDPQLGGRVERVVVFGHPTLSREVSTLLSRPEVEVIARGGAGEPLQLNGTTLAAERIEVAAGSDPAWLAAWLRAGRAASVDLDPPAPDAAGLSSADPHTRLPALAEELAVLRRPVDRAMLVDAVWRATWPHDRLVFGSSRLVRVADDVLAGKRVTVHANRGLAGIDGTVATAIGVALASQADGHAGVTRLLLGDLALLHDVGALLVGAGERMPRLQVIVGNDGGGTIFDGLEVGRSAASADLDRVMYTPHSVALASLAAAYGWACTRATTRAELDAALLAPTPACRLIEVPLPR